MPSRVTVGCGIDGCFNSMRAGGGRLVPDVPPATNMHEQPRGLDHVTRRKQQMPGTAKEGKITTKPGTTTTKHFHSFVTNTTKPIRTYLAPHLKRTRPGRSFHFHSNHLPLMVWVVATRLGGCFEQSADGSSRGLRWLVGHLCGAHCSCPHWHGSCATAACDVMSTYL